MAQQGYPMGSVVAHNPAIFGKQQVQTTCPNCRSLILTTVTMQRGNFSYLIAIIVCLLCWPCAWVPLLVDNCRDVYHSCPACNAALGARRQL